MGEKLREMTVIQAIRASVEKGFSGPPPLSENEQKYSIVIIRNYAKMGEFLSGKKVEIPKRPKEGD